MKRIFTFFLIFCLVLSFLVFEAPRSYAATGSTSMYVPSGKSTMDNVMLNYYFQFTNNGHGFFDSYWSNVLDQNINGIGLNHVIIVSDPDYTHIFIYCNANGFYVYQGYIYPDLNTPTAVFSCWTLGGGGLYWYDQGSSLRPLNNTGNFSNDLTGCTVFSNYPLYDLAVAPSGMSVNLENSRKYFANLLGGSYITGGPRLFDVTKDRTYLDIVADAEFDEAATLTVTYVDSSSNANVFTFSQSSFFSQTFPDGYWHFKVDSFEISAQIFTVTQVVLNLSDDSILEVEDLSYVFNELDYSPGFQEGSVYYNPTYVFSGSDVSQVRSGSDVTLVFDGNPIATHFYDLPDHSLVLPFSYSYCFFPELDAVFQFEASDIFDYFDVVFYGCSNELFELVYHEDVPYIFQDETLFSVEALLAWYSNHPATVIPGYPVTNVVSFDCSVHVSDDIYAKGLLFSLGETNDFLLEFEGKLIGDLGVLQSIQNKQNLIANTVSSWFLQHESWFITSGNFFRKIADLNFLERVLDALESSGGGLGDEDPVVLPEALLVLFNFGHDAFNVASDYLTDFSRSVSALSHNELSFDNPEDVGSFIGQYGSNPFLPSPSPTPPLIGGD